MKQNISFIGEAEKAKDDDVMNVINDGLTYYIGLFVKTCTSESAQDCPLISAALRIVADQIDKNLPPDGQQMADVCYSYKVMDLAHEKREEEKHPAEQCMAETPRRKEAERNGRLVEQKAIPGNTVWIVERDENGQAYDVSGYMFIAEVGDYVLLSPFIDDYDDLISTMDYHVVETVDNYTTDLAVFPAADCYLTRERAEAALEGENQ